MEIAKTRTPSARARKNQERTRRQFTDPVAEAPLHQFVGGEHFAAEVLWQEQNRDDDSGHQIPEYHLEKAEIAVKCQRRRADDGQSTRFGGHDGETDCPPGRVPPSKEIVLERFLRGSETRAEPRDADKIGEDDTDIEVAHRMHRSLAHGILESSVMAGTSRQFARIYKYVVVAGGGNLRYTPQVRGFQRSLASLGERRSSSAGVCRCSTPK